MTSKYVTTIDDGQIISIEGVGLLCGVEPAEALAEYARQQEIRPGRFVIPKAWVRGSKELQAKYGTRDYFQLLAHIEADRGAA